MPEPGAHAGAALAPSYKLADCLVPQWSVSPRVRALITTRAGGVSAGPYGSRDGARGLNLGLHTGDLTEAVLSNRARLSALCQVPPAWIEQVHGNTVVEARHALVAASLSQPLLRADASVTDQTGVACVVMVADCMPVLLCDAAGSAVGAAHAGWRGLVSGVIERTAQDVARRAGAHAQLHAFLGPAIGPLAFEVGAEVRAAFLDAALPAEEAATAAAFADHPEHTGKFLADLYALARVRLARVGVSAISGADHCTYSEAEQFYSFRRDRVTGRFAALIWLDDAVQTNKHA